MRMKFLLSLALATSVATTAAAFPSYTLTPANESTFDDAYYLESINVVFSSKVTIAAGASATLTDQMGNSFKSTEIKDFSAMQAGTYIVKFDSSKLEYNGNYTLTVPAGTFTASGESSEEIVANYTMNSRFLTEPGAEKTTYDPITLISSDPEDGSTVMGFGSVSGWTNQVSFNTSNNDAVNYIGWELWDVTDPENPEYVYQSNENRIDTNRNGNSNDSWGSTPKITIGGEAVKLMQGHTFEMKLIFAGIGYDPATNQYPSPQQIELSKLLETSIYFQGGMAPPVYSPYEVTYVSPGDGYEIADPEFSFIMAYSGPVKPTQFTYFNGPGDSPVAGTYKAMGEVDENGCSSVWQYTFSNGILQAVEGTIMVNIVAKDAEGKTVKGSGDYDYDNNIYNVTFVCNLGADVVTLASPVDGVTALEEVSVTNNANKKMSYMSGTATITDANNNTVRTLDAPEANAAETVMTWKFEPITDRGTYVLNIPAAYFSIGEETNASSNNETLLNLVVIGGAYYNVEVTEVSPAAGSTVEEFSSIEFGIPADTDVVTGADGKIAATASLYSVSAGGVETLLEEGVEGEIVNGYDESYFPIRKVKYTFSEAYSEAGQYRVKVDKGLFGDTKYSESNGAEGHASGELTYDYFISNSGSGDNPSGDGSAYVLDFNKPISQDGDGKWVLDEGWGHIFGWFEDAENYPEKGTFEHRVEYTHNTTGGKYDSGYLTCGNQNYKDNSMWYDAVHVNDMFVTPLVRGKVTVSVRAAKLQSWLTTAAKIRVFEINADGSKGEMVKELTAQDFGYEGDTPDWEEVVLVDPSADSYSVKTRAGEGFKRYGLSFSNMDIDDLTAEEVSKDGDTPTSVQPVLAPVNAEEDVIYTLTGVRVKNPGKGIYIVNGKKVVIK